MENQKTVKQLRVNKNFGFNYWLILFGYTLARLILNGILIMTLKQIYNAVSNFFANVVEKVRRWFSKKEVVPTAPPTPVDPHNPMINTPCPSMLDLPGMLDLPRVDLTPANSNEQIPEYENIQDENTKPVDPLHSPTTIQDDNGIMQWVADVKDKLDDFSKDVKKESTDENEAFLKLRGKVIQELDSHQCSLDDILDKKNRQAYESFIQRIRLLTILIWHCDNKPISSDDKILQAAKTIYAKREKLYAAIEIKNPLKVTLSQLLILYSSIKLFLKSLNLNFKMIHEHSAANVYFASGRLQQLMQVDQRINTEKTKKGKEAVRSITNNLETDKMHDLATQQAEKEPELLAILLEDDIPKLKEPVSRRRPNMLNQLNQTGSDTKEENAITGVSNMIEKGLFNVYKTKLKNRRAELKKKEDISSTPPTP